MKIDLGDGERTTVSKHEGEARALHRARDEGEFTRGFFALGPRSLGKAHIESACSPL
jgi:hypothetical protein